MNNKIKIQFNNIPSSPGVYFFKNDKEQIIYIGKSASLKARVKSYFIKNALHGIKAAMLENIVNIDYKITDTEIDALILESQLIKKHQPKYNVLLKDDKDYFYVAFSPDIFPKVFVTHQIKRLPIGTKILGPYTDGKALKMAMKYLRKTFPFCTCFKEHKIPCLKSHIGLCLGVCCLKDKSLFNKEIVATYHKNIIFLKDILSGKRKNIVKKIEKDMKLAVLRHDFERAANLRDKMFGLENIFEHNVMQLAYGADKDRDFESIKKELSQIFGKKIKRVEFYDVSNIQGELAVASMVVFDGEKLNKSHYRKFKIKTILGANDPAMMEEVLRRRFKRSSLGEGKERWPMPDLVIVDGGVTQLGAARKVLNENNLKSISVASLAKNPDRLFLPPHLKISHNFTEDQYFIERCGGESPIKQIALKDLSDDARLLLQNLRDEAHRFAIGYHKKLRHKKLKDEFDKI